MKYPERVHLREVCPRDGLQNEPTHLTTQQKIELIDMVVDAGFARVNATSFVSPKAIPQMADAGEIMSGIRRVRGVEFDASVPNTKGAGNALAADVDILVTFVATSEIASQRNQRCSVDAAMAQAEEVVRMGRAAGKNVVGTVAMAFGSPYGDDVTDTDVLRLVKRFVDAGATGIALGDTIGSADPRSIARLSGAVLEEIDDLDFALHLHDPYGHALANVVAAMDAGVTHFDCAIGGIGGSPFTANASGNLATEDLVHLCHSMGVETGVDLDAVLDISAHLEQILEHPLPGRLGAFTRRTSTSA